MAPTNSLRRTGVALLAATTLDWVRTSGEYDAVADFDRALADPADRDRILPAYDSGDHLHPGDAGYRAMAEALDLDAF